ncbi:MAG: hypothetical protein P8X58_13245 [Syntrophobacterales bacterium]
MEFSREKHFSQYNAGSGGRQPKPGVHRLEKNGIPDFSNLIGTRGKPPGLEAAPN